MNKTRIQAAPYARRLVTAEDKRDGRTNRFVVPPFTSARDVKSILSSTSVRVGAQNMQWEDHRAWTGEISPPMRLDCGFDMVELGHNERRTRLGETDETVGLKVAAALRHGLTPLICVGETRAEPDAGKTQRCLEVQVRGALAQLDKVTATDS